MYCPLDSLSKQTQHFLGTGSRNGRRPLSSNNPLARRPEQRPPFRPLPLRKTDRERQYPKDRERNYAFGRKPFSNRLFNPPHLRHTLPQQDQHSQTHLPSKPQCWPLLLPRHLLSNANLRHAQHKSPHPNSIHPERRRTNLRPR